MSTDGSVIDSAQEQPDQGLATFVPGIIGMVSLAKGSDEYRRAL
jgi:hypothetical protein